MTETQDMYPVRYTIPMHLHVRLTNAIGHRAMHIVGEQHSTRNRIVSQREDLRAMRQAKAEALQEAIEDWLAKPKDAKWF